MSVKSQGRIVGLWAGIVLSTVGSVWAAETYRLQPVEGQDRVNRVAEAYAEAPGLVRLAEGLNGSDVWKLRYNPKSLKMEIFGVSRGNAIRHWVEDSVICGDESGSIRDAWAYRILCFRAAPDNRIPIGGPIPKIYLIEHASYARGRFVMMHLAVSTMTNDPEPDGNFSIVFRSVNREEPLFQYNDPLLVQ